MLKASRFPTLWLSQVPLPRAPKVKLAGGGEQSFRARSEVNGPDGEEGNPYKSDKESDVVLSPWTKQSLKKERVSPMEGFLDLRDSEFKGFCFRRSGRGV